MIIYSSTKEGFLDDVFKGDIADRIDSAFYLQLGRYTSSSEKESWKNSLMYMNNVLNTDQIPDEAKVAIEYQIPTYSKRIDFIIYGLDQDHKQQMVIVELKQWSSAQLTGKDGVVRTRFMHGEEEKPHPSYQAWSYAKYLYDYSEALRDEEIGLKPCAYLHNYKDDRIITHNFYQEYIDQAPLFLKPDAGKLREFICKYVKYSCKNDLLYLIENGRIIPSKQLADTVRSMLKGNREFLLLDEQKIVYETVISLLPKIKEGKKQVLVVEGGPGTGKSVIAINLLADLINRKLLARYVSKNAAPREVYTDKLAGEMSAHRIKSLFGGSGSFVDAEADTFDVLIVDEAHRLNLKSGRFQNQGHNQVLEIINAAKISVFFVDDNQMIHIKDIGRSEAIKNWAKDAGATVHTMKLKSQFRCNGSDGYLNWLDNTLQKAETANFKLSPEDFDFRVFSDPNDLRNAIMEKNRVNNKSRLVAGYCWDWNSKDDASAYDIVLDDFNFQMKWNLTEDGSKWIIAPESVNQIGCIHTCQGLELDYVGVIVGYDLQFRDGQVITDVNHRSKNDHSVRGMKKALRENPVEAKQLADQIIKNTYRTLMTRGMKGCYVYFCDPLLAAHFQNQLKTTTEEGLIEVEIDPYRIEPVVLDNVKYIDYLPVYSMKAACGMFGDGELVEEIGWMKVEGAGRLNRNMFIVQASGHSMEPRIQDGDYCIFRSNVVGSRNGKIVLVQHYNHYDPDNTGSYSIKKYMSEKSVDPETGQWSHDRIILRPENKEYDPIVLENQEEGFMVIGEFIGVVKES